jgi:hypothetical protein
MKSKGQSLPKGRKRYCDTKRAISEPMPNGKSDFYHKDDEVEGWVLCANPRCTINVNKRNCKGDKGVATDSYSRKPCVYYGRTATLQEILDGKAVKS